MDARKPAAAYNQCPYRNGRTMPAAQMRTPAQAPAASRASASALSRPQPPVQPAAQPAPNPPPQPTMQPSARTTVQPPSAPVPPVQTGRAHLSAYAKDFHVAAEEGKKQPLPLEAQRSEGGMGIDGGITTLPEDGYHMVLWEMGVAGAQGEATLQLGINDAASQLTYALHPGYDSGQQVTWLNKGDKLGLFVQAGDGKAEIDCGSAQFTVIRLG